MDVTQGNIEAMAVECRKISAKSEVIGYLIALDFGGKGFYSAYTLSAK